MRSEQNQREEAPRSGLDIRSVDQAEKMISSLDAKPEIKEERCYQLADSILRNHETGKGIYGSSDAFHNFSVHIIRCCSDYLTAWEIARLGSAIHTGNTDLLADMLRYGYNCGKRTECEETYRHLKAIDNSRWTSRAFSFVIDYLIYLSTDQGDRMAESELQNIIKKFKELYPKDDDSYFREYEMYKTRNDFVNAKKALENAIEKLDSCPKCQLSYADMMCEQGAFEDAIDAILKLCDDTNAPDSVNMAYVYMLKGRIQVAIMNKGNKDPLTSGSAAAQKRKSLFSRVSYDLEEVDSTYESFRLSLTQNDLMEQTKKKVVNEVNTLHEKSGIEIPKELAELMRAAK